MHQLDMAETSVLALEALRRVRSLARMSALLQSASVTGPEQHGQKTTSATGRQAPGAGSLTHADRRGALAPRHAAMRASPGRAQHLLVVPGLNLTEHGRSRWANRGTQHAPPSRSPSKPARQSSQAKDKGQIA
jgi:hypothetical protein